MEHSLRDILASKRKQLDDQEPKWRQKKQQWLHDVGQLYDDIEAWLADLIKDGYITVSRDQTTVSEDLLGVYSVDKLKIIFFNNQQVTLTPKGLHVIGAAGRIDMTIGSRVIMIVRVDDNLEWTFAEREGRGKPKRWEFNENTFKELLAEYAEEF
jgi:hypothetical protein